MSSEQIKEKKNEEKKLLGNKQKSETKIDGSEKNIPICNLCKMEKNSIIKCTKCNKNYCLSCINLKIDNKKKYEDLISDEEKKTNWICFNCENELNSNKNIKCLLCDGKSNIINYDNIITLLTYSDDEKNKLKENDDLKKIIDTKTNCFLCNLCSEKKIIKQFLDNKSVQSILENKNNIDVDINKLDENKTKENIFNVLEKQSENSNSQNKKINQNVNFTNIKNDNINSFNSIHYPIINNIQEINQIPNFNLNIPKNTFNPINPSNSINDSFPKITEIPNFDNSNIRNHLGVLSNVNQLTEILNSIISNNTNINNNNNNNNNSTTNSNNNTSNTNTNNNNINNNNINNNNSNNINNKKSDEKKR